MKESRINSFKPLTKPTNTSRYRELFKHHTWKYINGKIDVHELNDRILRLDSMMNEIDLIDLRDQRIARLIKTNSKVDISHDEMFTSDPQGHPENYVGEKL